MTPEDTLKQVAKAYRLHIRDMLSLSRNSLHVMARQDAMWRLRQQGFSYPSIAYLLNRKDHTTALHGVKTHARRLAQGREKVAEVVG